MAESLDTLVADADRATAADEMRLHHDSGRLTLDEIMQQGTGEPLSDKYLIKALSGRGTH